MKRCLLFSLVCMAGLLWSCDKYALPGPNNQQLGAAAHDLLSADTYTRLQVEVQYMTGFQLQAGTIANLGAFLQARLNKPGGITVTQTEIPASGNTSFDLDNVKEIESNRRTAFTEDSVIAVYILVTDGGYSSPEVLGIAYRNTSVCLFGKPIHDNSGGITQPSRVKLETTVVLHELGHLMGLVDTGSPMVTAHRDGPHGAHCNNANCLMYYQVETTDFLGFLMSGNIPSLDANCVADLQANGGL